MLQPERDPVDTTKEISNVVKHGVIMGIYESRGYGEFQIDGIDTAQLARESLQWRTRMLARPVSDWTHVKRATFFPDEQEGLAQNVFSAKRFVPKLAEAATLIQQGVRSAGEELDIEPLASYSINRIGINYMFGKRKRQSEIPPHTDVETQHGVVVVLRLSEGPSTRIVNNNTQVIFSHDVCRAYDMPQYEHGVTTNLRRISATFAELRR